MINKWTDIRIPYRGGEGVLVFGDKEFHGTINFPTYDDTIECLLDVIKVLAKHSQESLLVKRVVISFDSEEYKWLADFLRVLR